MNMQMLFYLAEETMEKTKQFHRFQTVAFWQLIDEEMKEINVNPQYFATLVGKFISFVKTFKNGFHKRKYF